ncbi:MAG: LicD family protein [Oscillospiraceae bacterium]|nr:LicD family protein [Oscillospiraceae bacterium]
MGLKQAIKGILLKISPTYKKVNAIQDKANGLQDREDAIQGTVNIILGQVSVIQSQISELQAQLSRIERNMASYQIQTRTMLWWLQSDEPANVKMLQKKFWMRYPRAEGDMRIVQAGNMYVLRALKKICDENGLKFWLHGGTLIGAMRHNGCIPWDDDVDVAMMREDIDKLFEVLESNTKFKLNTYYHDNHTFSRGYQFKLANGEIPNFVDIFVFDSCNVETQEDVAEHIRIFSEARGSMIEEFLAYEPQMIVQDIGCNHWGPFSEENAKIADEMIERGLEQMGDRKNGNSIYYAIDNYPFPYPVIPKEEMFPTIEHEFEGVMYDIPRNPDLYLRGYGDYWQVPKDIENAPHFYYFEPHIQEIEEFLKSKDFFI